SPPCKMRSPACRWWATNGANVSMRCSTLAFDPWDRCGSGARLTEETHATEGASCRARGRIGDVLDSRVTATKAGYATRWQRFPAVARAMSEAWPSRDAPQSSGAGWHVVEHVDRQDARL